ncbi:Hypothetical protein ADU72_1379 [Pediococcus damnosus]|uniref:YfhO family protein n=1 Tax=Pediococcus damnosus TaxID=51663 RepID=A0A0R2GYL8_9LACO|nr:YfhO family protein [Pediococcus damnosus]AMV62807.1 Hypothetical protein ADU70_1319 [Pediococcus damnosus]AMV67308.1 Hypothetical protein ADU72_1379 [Pediococcus damnosus]KRN45227.1 hypothetical protein IV84_GL000159 [Pediococcus damnosus]PJE49123.1 hypothetical protein BSQ36_03845 [Pediococcus damnosus]
MHSEDRRAKKGIFWKYTLVFLIIIGLTYGIFYFLGLSLLSNHDVIQQHVPINYELHKLLLRFFKDPLHPQYWSWKIGLGGDIIQHFGFYVMGDPFAYITALFPTRFFVKGFQIVSLLRLYFVGLSFLIISWKMGHRKLVSTLAGTICYISSGFALFSVTYQPFFLNILILLPIFVYSINLLFFSKQIMPFALTVMLILLNNLYFAYMFVTGGLLYVILLYAINFQKIKKESFTILARFSGASILGVGLSAWLVIPELIGMLNSGRSEGISGIFKLIKYPLSYYLNLPSLLIGGNKFNLFWLTSIGSSLVFIAIVHVIFNYRKYRELVCIYIAATVMLLLPVFASIFNGFSLPSNRWTFLLTFPFALSVVFFIDDLSKISDKEKKLWFYSCVIVSFYVALVDSILGTATADILSLAFLFVLLLILLMKNHIGKKWSRIFILVVMLNSIIWISFSFYPRGRNLSRELLPFRQAKMSIRNPFYNNQKNVKTNTRVMSAIGVKSPISVISQNASLVSPYSYINSYYSIQSKSLTNFGSDMQILNGTNLVPLTHLDSRSTLLRYLGVQYYINNSPNYAINGYEQKATFYQKNIYFHKSISSLPIAFWQSNLQDMHSYNKELPSVKEAGLAYTAAVNDPADLKHGSISNNGGTVLHQFGTAKRKSKVVSFSKNKTNVISYNTNKSNTSLKLRLPKGLLQQQNELHLDISKISFEPYEPGKRSVLKRYQNFGNIINNSSSDRNTWSMLFSMNNKRERLAQPGFNDPGGLSFYKKITTGVVNMGGVQNKNDYITLRFEKPGKYKFRIKMIQLDAHSLTKKFSKLTKSNKKVSYFNNGLNTRIKTKSSGIIETTIPYSKGWKATIDKKNAKIIKVNNAFIGVVPNKHKNVVNLKLVYRTPGKLIGAFITALFILMIFVYFLLKRKAVVDPPKNNSIDMNAE